MNLKKIIIVPALCWLLLSCNKEAELAPAPGVAYLMFYNGAPGFYGAGSMVLVNNAATDSLEYNDDGRGLVGAFNASKYNIADTGVFRIAFTGKRDTEGKTAKITERNYHFEANLHYTLYLADSLGFYETLVTKDDVKADPLNAKIRLIHLGADCGEVHMKMDTAAIKGMEQVRFRQVTDYVSVAPDVKPGIRILATDPVSGEEKSVVRKSFPLEAGKCYTMILRGYKTPPDGNVNKTMNLSTLINF
jgi:hypothetical protein